MSEFATLKKDLFGRYQLHYRCARCKAGLVSPLNDAGKTDECPECQLNFTVPGTELRDDVRRKAEQDAASKSAMKEEKRRAAAEAREERKRDRERKQHQQQSFAAEHMERQKVCPYCGEAILAVARKCKHCGEFLDGTKPRPVEVVRKPSASRTGCGCATSAFIVLLLAVILGPCGPNDPGINDRSTDSMYSRAVEVVQVFLRDDDYQLSKAQEYDSSGGGTIVKGTCEASGQMYLWAVAFDASGNVVHFFFDDVTILAKQPAGHLSYLPDNEQYVTNDVLRLPTLGELRASGIDAKEGY